MSDQIEVRLRYPNLGAAAGDVVSMDPATARAWCARGLADHVDDGAARHDPADPHPLADLIHPPAEVSSPAPRLRIPTVG